MFETLSVWKWKDLCPLQIVKFSHNHKAQLLLFLASAPFVTLHVHHQVFVVMLSDGNDSVSHTMRSHIFLFVTSLNVSHTHEYTSRDLIKNQNDVAHLFILTHTHIVNMKL